MDKLNSLVTVIIPAYNHEKYIVGCIESIINEDYANIELIILNDGSKDKTADKILEYEEKCKKRFIDFIFIDKKNEGLSKTLNKGIELSKGKYICCIASDDMMMSGRIKKQVKFMEERESVISCGNAFVIKNNKKTDISVIDDELKKNYFTGSQFHNLIVNYFISSPTVMMKKCLIDEMGSYDERFKIEDWPYYVKVAQKHHIDFIDDYLCYYRIHDHNTQTNKKNMFIEEKKIIKYFFDTYKLPFFIKRKALSKLYIRNKMRNDSYIGKVRDVLLSQIYYLDIRRILRYLHK